ncbi:MAG: SDR family NAD(P)-dependent oxidoreductase [Bacteroidales bacterium]|nr:SDR family NAD(P)-dependent oxidoreductase [Bacteroidales bacterium]
MGMVILITGASSGIGNEAARLLAAKGHKVYAAARRTELLEPLRQNGIIPLRLDVTDEASCRECVQAVTAAEGRIDAIVNNAGYGSLGPIECVTMDEARRQVDTNLLGMAYLCSLVIPLMRSQGAGRIVNISSIAGTAPMLYGGWYNVSKYGVEALTDNLRIELKPFGIKVIKIEPGGIKTPWGRIAADHLEDCTRGSAYSESAKREADFLRKHYDGKVLTPPSVVARKICRAVTARHPRVRYRPGLGAGFIIVAHAILPVRWWDAIAGSLGKVK